MYSLFGWFWKGVFRLRYIPILYICLFWAFCVFRNISFCAILSSLYDVQSSVYCYFSLTSVKSNVKRMLIIKLF